MWLALLLVLALVAIGLAAYQATSNGVQKGVKLKEDVQGQVNDAVDQLKGLIELVGDRLAFVSPRIGNENFLAYLL